ncbi:MAG: cation diffusion facilitator family transporter [Solirubrobacteraceae bacterium]
MRGASSPSGAGARRGAGGSPPHRALILAFAANAAAAVVKLAAFAVSGASVLLAEGLHSVADCGNQGALLLGHRGAASPPSDRYPLGVGRVRYLWAFFVAVVVFGGSAVISFGEATYRVLDEGHADHLGVTLGALGVAVVIEAASMFSAVREAGPAKGEGTWGAFLSGTRDPDAVVLLVEDLADLVGLGLALLATVLVEVTGLRVLDAVASYLIGLVLAANAVFLTREMASLVIGEAADSEVEEAVRAALMGAGWGDAGVQAVHIGPTEVLVIIQLQGASAALASDPRSSLRRAAARAAASTPLTTRILFEVDQPGSGGAPP